MNNNIEAIGIVRSNQGSWRWQTPYTVRGYKTRKLKNNEVVYYLSNKLSRKLTYKKALSFARYAADGLPIFRGGLHNVRPINLNIKNSLNHSQRV